jgi:hypothetical protein
MSEEAELARAMRRHTHRQIDGKVRQTEYAVVVDVEPVAAERTRGHEVLDEDDLVYGQNARAYDTYDGIAVGDTLVLNLMPNGDWFVHDVLSENEPSGGGGGGTVLAWKGTVPNQGALPSGAVEGDAWVTEDDDHVWVWDGAAWVDLGDITGPQGPIGQTGAQGPIGQTGAQGPQGTPGAQGPVGPQGETGAQGPQGIQGVQGPTGQAEAWHSGTSAPAGGLGAVGDWHLNTTSGDVSEKTDASTWTVRGNIRGPQGIQGVTGTAGAKWFTQAGAPAGATGVVGDFSLDSTNGDYYEKTGASTWTLRGNLRGPQGIQGIQGIQGPDGGAEVYKQPNTPTPVEIGALWIDTDEPDPAPSTVTITLRTGQTWVVGGALSAGQVVPPFYVPVIAGQTSNIIGVRAKVGAATSIVAQLTQNGTNIGSAVTITTTKTTTTFGTPVTAADGDEIGVTLSSPSGSPSDLSLTVILEHTA